MRLRNLIASLSSTVVNWATQWTHVFAGGVTITGTLIASLGATQTASITGAGQTITPSAGTGFLVITAATNDAFTLGTPAGTPISGQRLLVLVINASGGAMGAMTIPAGFFFTAFTSPANGARRMVEFIFGGTTWNQNATSAADLT